MLGVFKQCGSETSIPLVLSFLSITITSRDPYFITSIVSFFIASISIQQLVIRYTITYRFNYLENLAIDSLLEIGMVVGYWRFFLLDFYVWDGPIHCATLFMYANNKTSTDVSLDTTAFFTYYIQCLLDYTGLCG